jgi:hypothetical protein
VKGTDFLKYSLVGTAFSISSACLCTVVVLQEVRCKGVDWINLIEDRDRWRALVNAVMGLGGSIKCGELLG